MALNIEQSYSCWELSPRAGPIDIPSQTHIVIGRRRAAKFKHTQQEAANPFLIFSLSFQRLYWHSIELACYWRRESEKKNLIICLLGGGNRKSANSFACVCVNSSAFPQGHMPLAGMHTNTRVRGGSKGLIIHSFIENACAQEGRCFSRIFS